MGSKNLNDQIEWEASRVAAAFGLEVWEGEAKASPPNFWAEEDEGLICWQLSPQGLWDYIALSDEDGIEECVVCFEKTPWPPHQKDWYCVGNPKFDHKMACGLYRLGFEEEAVLNKLPKLSDEEKLELRENFPREFWPQSWSDVA